jgi:hypothetical protein
VDEWVNPLMLPALVGLVSAVVSILFALRFKRWVYAAISPFFLLLSYVSFVAGFFLIIAFTYFPLVPVHAIPQWLYWGTVSLVPAGVRWLLLRALHENEGCI